ncbi:MAG: tRNA (5-methylaminomethyl-2-thiouridine)(34)-methyltransferase MnmD [Bacteroidota bacterium]|jgi:tRNA U34 5-methylaminomethyl-2-thiouridine-forming methyltransferase MnmC
MKREIILTADGSHSVYCVDTDETYHSKHGAMQESVHVFIRNGLDEVLAQTNAPRILEIGFGTGLNALLTLSRMEECSATCDYVAIEKFPLDAALVEPLDFIPSRKQEFMKLHLATDELQLQGRMRLRKVKTDFRDPMPTIEGGFQLVYFDAFSPTKQPELWTETIFTNIRNVCAPGAILVTYCSKGEVRRSMQAAGWKVTKLPGPKGKREMVRAINDLPMTNFN